MCFLSIALSLEWLSMLGCTDTSSFYPEMLVAAHFCLLELFKMKSKTGNNDACWEMWDQLTTLFNVAFIVLFFFSQKCESNVKIDDFFMGQLLKHPYFCPKYLWPLSCSINISFPLKIFRIFLELHAWVWVCRSYVLPFGDGTSLTMPGTLFPV